MRALLLGACLGVMLACSGSPPACPNDLPMSCPADAPGYAATIAPLIQKRCLECHSPANNNPPDLSTYSGVSNQRGVVLTQLYGCLMPPPDAGQPTAEERGQFLSWLKCGAMNN
ncbi:MAG: hypothetical protein QM723_14765 [Myxococcaceae bacterium]